MNKISPICEPKMDSRENAFDRTLSVSYESLTSQANSSLRRNLSDNFGQKELTEVVVVGSGEERQERATCTVPPSIQAAATSTSDLTNSYAFPSCSLWYQKPTVCERKDALIEESGDRSFSRVENSQVQADAVSLSGTNSEGPMCRICHCNEVPDIDNIMIAPCLCAGSLRMVHQACLQHWIKASNTRACELCKFEFMMRVSTKPFSKWEKLEMTPNERKKTICTVSFHLIALTCVVWSLYVLIERTSSEIASGQLEWPFWTKLVVIAVGLTGGLVFMYVQCRTYAQLCRRWRSYNRTFFIQTVPEGILVDARARAKAKALNGPVDSVDIMDDFV